MSAQRIHKCEKCKKKISEREIAGGNHFWSRYYCEECWQEHQKETLRWAGIENIEDPSPPTW